MLAKVRESWKPSGFGNQSVHGTRVSLLLNLRQTQVVFVVLSEKPDIKISRSHLNRTTTLQRHKDNWKAAVLHKGHFNSRIPLHASCDYTHFCPFSTLNTHCFSSAATFNHKCCDHKFKKHLKDPQTANSTTFTIYN